MNDERMIRRSTFGFENFGNRFFIAGVSGQTINRLCRQTQQVTRAQSFNGLLHMQRVVARNDHVSKIEMV